jgi:septum formation protein
MARYRGTMRVLLASTSPARRALLRQAGIEPLTLAPEVDEDAVIHALDVVARLALEDADFDGLVIGGDSMFELDGLVLGKPHEPAIATERWHAMRGRTGILHSGHSVYRVIPGRTPVEAHAVAHASVTFVEDVTDAEIEAYVATGEPLAVAGAFTVDSLGGPFISRVEGDPSTVVGMSLSTLRKLARELGVAWTELWNRSEESAEHP